VLAALLHACATPVHSQSHLTSAEVGRIADVQVGGLATVSRDFDRVKLSYSSDKHVWFVDYRDKKTGYVKYNVEIDDNTGQATTIVNDYW
jgi:hypothetical protein